MNELKDLLKKVKDDCKNFSFEDYEREISVRCLKVVNDIDYLSCVISASLEFKKRNI